MKKFLAFIKRVRMLFENLLVSPVYVYDSVIEWMRSQQETAADGDPSGRFRELQFLQSRLAHLTYSEPHLLGLGEAIAPLPHLVMPDRIFRELVYFFSRMPQEMQVMGFVEKDDMNAFRVSGLVIPPHGAGLAFADLDQDQFPKWLDDLEQAGNDINHLRLQAHSHGFLEAYFSREDIDTIQNAYSCDWMISVVGNRRGVFLSRLDLFRPIPLSISLPLIVEEPQFRFSKQEKERWKRKLSSNSPDLLELFMQGREVSDD